MISKQTARRVQGAANAEVAPCAMAVQMPLLFDHLTQRRYDDGSPRRTSSLLLFNDEGTLKLMLREPDAGLCCWVGGESLEGVFAALEAALGDPEHEWRVDRQQPGQKATRVKR